MTVKFSSEKSESGADNPLNETIQMVKDYARQETLGPLKGWARYLGFGAAGSLVLGIGFVIAALGILRLLQTETSAFEGPSTSILAYLITLAVCVLVIALTLWQISRRTSLQRKEDAS